MLKRFFVNLFRQKVIYIQPTPPGKDDREPIHGHLIHYALMPVAFKAEVLAGQGTRSVMREHILYAFIEVRNRNGVVEHMQVPAANVRLK